MELKIQSVKAGRKEILSGIDLTIPEGNCIALLGRNGSGKSTLVNSITAHPAFKVKADKIEIAEPVFLGFQKPVEIPEITTGNFLLYLDDVYGRKSKDIDTFVGNYLEVLAELDITRTMLEQPLNRNVSGGENKRIELLQMYIIKPKTVLLDEIDTGLDLDMLITVGEFIHKFLQDHNCTTIVVTHNISFLKYFNVSKVIILDQGKIIRSEKPAFIKILEQKGFAKVLSEK